MTSVYFKDLLLGLVEPCLLKFRIGKDGEFCSPSVTVVDYVLLWFQLTQTINSRLIRCFGLKSNLEWRF